MFHLRGQLPLVCCRRLLGLLLGRLGCFLLRLLSNCWVGLSSVKPGLAPSIFVDILIFSLFYRVFGVPDWREKHGCDSMVFFVLVRRVCFLFLAVSVYWVFCCPDRNSRPDRAPKTYQWDVWDRLKYITSKSGPFQNKKAPKRDNFYSPM